MATQRATGKASSEEKNGEVNGGSKASAIQNRQARKQKLQQEKRFHERLRWLVLLLVLVIAALALYYYYTNYQFSSSPSPATKTRAPNDEGSKGHKQQPTKGEKQKKKAGGSDKEKKSIKSKRKSGGDGRKKDKEKVNPDPVEAIEKLKNRVLRQPIPGGDVDRPHVIDLITADNLLVDKKYEEALERFNAILKQFPQSPRAQFGKGITLSYMAEIKKSNKLMDTAISFFRMAGLDSVVANDIVRIPSLVAMADKAQAKGDLKLALQGMEKLVELRPQSVVYANQLGVLYLTLGNRKKAKGHFKKCVKKFEGNHFASAHLGSILLAEKHYEQSLPLLLEGIREDPDVRGDGRFYNYAGEALTRLNRSEEALALYGEGVNVGVFPSVWQRSLLNKPGLRALPWWSADATGYMTDITRIEKQMKTIASEALTLFDEEKLVFGGGDGRNSPHFVLFSKGKKNVQNCRRAPRTCALLETFPEAASCKQGTIKFSSLPRHTHIAPHVGSTNTKLQILVGLHIDPQGGIRIRVAEDVKVVGDQQIGVLDESFEKEVWYVGEESAVYMTIDVWHPDLPEDNGRQLGVL